MNGLALCSGIGGLELGVRIATGGNARVVCHVERDAFAASALVARMEDQVLDRAPIWDDLTTFDGRPWRGIVDLVTAGIPCQPYSLAGKRLGHDDERALWPELVRIVEECEPAAVFIENTPDFLHHYGPVWAELWRLGFTHAPPLLHTASELGGPHERQRIFILAAHTHRALVWLESWRRSRASWRSTSIDRDNRHDHADTLGLRRSQGRTEPAIQRRQSIVDDARAGVTDAAGIATSRARTILRRGRSARRSGEALAYADSDGLAVQWSGWVFDRERQTLRHDIDRCSAGCRICGSHWSIESPPVRVDAGFPGRVDELRAIGNAVIPDVAAAAWTFLWDQLLASSDSLTGT